MRSACYVHSSTPPVRTPYPHRKVNTMTSKVLLLGGWPGSGKTTVAKILERDHGFTRVKFAGALKHMISALLRYQGVSEEEIQEAIEGETKNLPLHTLYSKTPRHAMQTLGTEWGRKCMGEDIWVDIAYNVVSHMYQTGINVVLDDCRFMNEIRGFSDFQPGIWWIKRPGVHKPESSHVSDNELNAENFEYILNNDGTVWGLEEAVRHGLSVF